MQAKRIVSLKISKLRQLVKDLGLEAKGDKRRKCTFVKALSSFYGGEFLPCFRAVPFMTTTQVSDIIHPQDLGVVKPYTKTVRIPSWYIEEVSPSGRSYEVEGLEFQNQEVAEFVAARLNA